MIYNITANASNCTSEDVFSVTEIAATTVIGAVALLYCPLGMLIGACLSNLVWRKNDELYIIIAVSYFYKWLEATQFFLHSCRLESVFSGKYTKVNYWYTL